MIPQRAHRRVRLHRFFGQGPRPKQLKRARRSCRAHFEGFCTKGTLSARFGRAFRGQMREGHGFAGQKRALCRLTRERHGKTCLYACPLRVCPQRARIKRDARAMHANSAPTLQPAYSDFSRKTFDLAQINHPIFVRNRGWFLKDSFP